MCYTSPTIHTPSKGFKSRRERAEVSNDCNISCRGLNPMREGETKALHVQERPHLFGQVPGKLFQVE